MANVQLNTLSPKKWLFSGGGEAPNHIDINYTGADKGARIGDLAIDTSTVPNKIWQCYRNTASNPLWREVGTGSTATAEDISYDNETSELSATNVQDAIDELKDRIPSLSASNISYEDTTGMLSAENVQDALDNVISVISGHSSYTPIIDLSTVTSLDITNDLLRLHSAADGEEQKISPYVLGLASLAAVSSEMVESIEVYRHFWVDAGALAPLAPTSADLFEFADSVQDLMTFGPDTNSNAYFKIAMPNTWDKESFRAKLYWTGFDETTGSVRWKLKARAVGNNEEITGTWGSEHTVTDIFTDVSGLHYTTLTNEIGFNRTPVDDDLIYVSVERDAESGTDTYTGDALLLGLKVRYKDALNGFFTPVSLQQSGDYLMWKDIRSGSDWENLVALSTITGPAGLSGAPGADGVSGESGVGTDLSAFHFNVSGEIYALDLKATPVSADIVIIEDSEDSYNKKRITLESLLGGETTGGFDSPITEYGQYIRGDVSGDSVAVDAGNIVTTEITANTDLALVHFTKGGLRANKATDVTLAIKTQANTAYVNGSVLDIDNIGAGNLLIDADAGVTLNGLDGGYVVVAQWQGCTLKRISENAWIVPNYDVT
ncbi:MAG TPA: hypothetical protein PLA71_00685 [Saccharofermentans sp.]|nr:hypothetical protein [Saccharofermentans sp.]